MFDHEKLDAYKHAIAFVTHVSRIVEATPPRGRPNALKHLDEASSSVALNIAEGNGKRSVADRVRYLEVARGSAFECAACLDVLVVRNTVTTKTAGDGKAILVRVVSTITKLIEWLEDHRERERERERERSQR